MSQIGQIIKVCAERTIEFGEVLAKDIDASEFASQPTVDGKLVDCCHPAFVYGHLSLYPSRLVTLAGGDANGFTPPEAWQDLFKAGAECKHDPDCSIYPSKDELLGAYTDWSRAGLAIISAYSHEQFDKPNPAGGTFSEVFPTIGIMSNFLYNNHAMMHFGQVSTWRRVFGLGSAM